MIQNMLTERFGNLKINEKSCKTKISWEKSQFQLTILEGSNAWNAIISKDKLSELAIQLGQESESYSTNLYSYLFNSEKYKFISFAIVNEEFLIFKEIDNKFRVKYFFTKLGKSEYHICAESLIDELLNKVNFLENQNVSHQILLNREIEERTSISEKYENLRKDIENREKELYSSFVLLLNEKKKRIQYLQEILNNKNHQKSNKTANISSIQTESVKNEKQQETISDSDVDDSKNSPDDDAYDTDEEKNQKFIDAINENNDQASTSKESIFSLFNNSQKMSLPQKRKQTNSEENSDVSHDHQNISNSKEMNAKIKKTGNDIFHEDAPVEFGTQDILDRL